MKRARPSPSPDLFQSANVLIPELRKGVLRWFLTQARDLPWRKAFTGSTHWLPFVTANRRLAPRRDPYVTWISEIMLQQTQVAAVIPHFKRWMKRFPDVCALAAAPESTVLRNWAGLGYYARARNARKTAQAIRRSGSFPATAGEWMALPGIGAYTAGAIASLSYGHPEPILDGNVQRVFSRLFGLAFLPKDGVEKREAYWSLSRLWARGPNPGTANEALMELGALICVPGNPRCDECPLARTCISRKKNWQRILPPMRRKERPAVIEGVAWVIRRGNRILMEERPPAQFLSGHLLFPLDLGGAVPEPAGGVSILRHSIMNNRYRFQVRIAADRNLPATRRGRKVKWIPEADLPDILTNSLARKIWAVVQGRGRVQQRKPRMALE